jgi:gluconolactonase
MEFNMLRFPGMLAAILLLTTAIGTLSADEPAKTNAITTVKLKELTLQLPKSWAESDLKSSMRLATYEIPAAEGDKEKGELAISTFPGGGGGVDQNLARWVDQFEAKGRTTAIKKGKAGENEYYIADLAGTYKKSVGPPILRKTEPAPGYRMLAVILVMKNEEVYFLKLTGPDKTIKAQAEAFRKTFGGSSGGEEPYEL